MPSGTGQIGKNVRFGLLALALLVVTILISLFLPHKASAAGLLPELASVDLPLGDTVLQPILSPVTDTTNVILPVDINPDSDSLGATIQPDSRLPLVGGSENPIASVSVPVQPS